MFIFRSIVITPILQFYKSKSYMNSYHSSPQLQSSNLQPTWRHAKLFNSEDHRASKWKVFYHQLAHHRLPSCPSNPQTPPLTPKLPNFQFRTPPLHLASSVSLSLGCTNSSWAASEYSNNRLLQTPKNCTTGIFISIRSSLLPITNSRTGLSRKISNVYSYS